MADSKKLVGVVVGLLGVCLVIVLGDSSAHHPNANFKGSPYGIKKVEHQALESSPVSEVDYVDGPLAPLYDFLIQHKLQRFCKLIRDAGLEQVIQELGGSWTLFAPTDASFIFLPGGTLEELQRNPQLLRDFILYHFVVGDFPSSQIQNELLVDSVQGSPLRFNIYGQTLMVSGAEILEPDLQFDLGRVYIIDRPLYPIPSEDTLAYLQRNHRQMYNMLVDVGLIDYISSGTFTLLIPDDQAFDYLSVELKDALATNISLAERILLNHILPGSIYVGGITDGMQWETAGGSPITFTVKRGLTFVEGIPIILPDISLTNGVIQVINRVILPEGIEADCQCKPSSETAQKPGQVSGRPTGQSQRPPYGQGATTRRPGQPAQTPRPGGSPVRGTTGQRGTPGTPSRPQGPVTSPGQPGSRPWSPSRTGQPNRPVPSPSQVTRSPNQPDAPSDEDINSVVGTGAQPDSGQKRPGQTTRYPPRQRVTPRPPQSVGSEPTRRPAGGAYPDSEKENYPEQDVTPGVPQTTRPGDRWSNRQRTPAPRYPTPQRGAYNTPTTRRPLTTRTYDWNQPRITQPPFERPDQGAGTDFPAENEDQGLQTQKPSVSTTSWQQRKQQTTRQPIQRTTFQPRQPVPPQRRTTIASSRTTTSPRIPSNQQPQTNCRRKGERITTINRNLPVCSVTPSEGCQNSPYNPADPRPLCPQSEDCRNPNDPSDPSDNRPLCASPAPVPEDCREVGQPTYTGDRRPLCPTSSVQQTGCKDPSAPYNPSDRRPICRTTRAPVTLPPSREPGGSLDGCRRANEVSNPQDRRPLCPTSSVQQTGCKDPSAPYNPSDRRPVCRTTRAPVTLPPSREPDGSLDGCRRANEVSNPQDRRPLCPEDIVPEDCREVGQPTYTGDRRPLCPTSSVQQTGCKDPSAPYNPSDRRPVCRTTRAPVTLPPSREPDGSPEGCRRANEVANPQDRRPLCPGEIGREDCREVGQPTYTGDRRPLCPTSSVQQTGCKDPSAPYNPSDRRPVCRTTRAPVTLPPSREPDGSPEGCRRANEVANPQDRRPLCPGEIGREDCREVGQPTYTGDRRPLCPTSSVQQTGCKDPSAPYNPSDRRPVCRTTRAPVTLPPSREPDGSLEGCRQANEVANPQDRRPLCPEETEQDCRPLLERPIPGDRRPICKASQPHAPNKDTNEVQKKPQQQTTYAPRGQYPTQTTRRQSWQSTTRAPQSWQSTTRASQSWQSTTRAPQSWQSTTRAPQRWQSTTRAPQSWQTTRQPVGKQPQTGVKQVSPQTGSGSFQTQPQTDSRQPQTGSYPSQPQSDINPSQPQSGSYPSQPGYQPSQPQTGADVQPETGTDLEPHTGVHPSQPQSGTHTSQPQSGRYPSQQQPGRRPSQQQSGRYPSQPQAGTRTTQAPRGSYPSQPQTGTYPRQRPGYPSSPNTPQTGAYPDQQPPSELHPSQPQSGSYPSHQPGSPGSDPSQPHSGLAPSEPEAPHSGSYPSQPHTGSHPSHQPGSPSSGSYPSQPQSGSYPSQRPGSPQSGSYPSQPQVGSFPSQRPGSSQTGSYPSQPQSGSYPSQQPGRPVSGSYPSQPQSGIDATQPGSHPSGPHPGDHSLQPGPGSPGSSQPSSGFDQPQTGRPSPGYPQRQPGSQQTPQGVSRPGSVGSRPSQPFNPQGRPVSGQGRPGGSLAPAPSPQRRPTTSTTRVPISVTGTSTTPGEDSRRTLYEIVEDPSLLIRGRPVRLTRIFELFHKAGIEDILTGPGPTTVFLPSDDAFALLPKGVVEQLEENPELLRQVLLYHVTQSEILPSAQPESYTIPSLEGNQLVITMLNGGRLIFVSGAKAVAVTRANNGIFYVINQLLYPLPQHDIVAAIQTRPDLSTLAYLLTLTGLEDMLRGQTPYTLLAPTDNAFAQLSQPVYDELTRNTTALQEILLNHIIEGAHYGREFFTGGTFPSARGGKLKFQVVSYGYQVNEINIKTPEIVTGTGVIHLIDQIVLEDSDLRFITNIENSVAGGDGSITDAQQPGSQQPGQGPISPRRPVSGESFTGAERPGANQPQVGGLQPSIGQPGPVGRLPTHGQGVSGSQPIIPGQPHGNQIGGQRQPGTGTFGQPGHGHQTPGHTTGSTTFGGRQPSVQGTRQPVQPQNQPGRQVPGQSGHSSVGGQRTPTHGQRTQTGTFTNQRQPATQVGGHQTPSGGHQNFGTSNTGGQPNNVADLARSMGLNQFANWITNTGLLEKVHDGGVYTVFAPTDDAVSSLPQDMVYSIESDPNQVKPILEYHIVPQKLNLNSITNDETASTLLQGKNIRFNVYKSSSPGCGQLVTASGTPVGEALATMGSIQVIPVTQVLYQPNGNLQNIVEASPILQKLNDAIKTARLTWILSGTGPMTIFAPSDSAFESLTEEERNTLVNDKQAFSDLLKRHILRGTYFASGVHEDLDKKSENNKPIRLSLQEGILTVNSIPVTYSDITATNGVLHVIDQFLN